MPENKNCPHCGESIQIDAVKCKYCKEFIDEQILSAVEKQEITKPVGLSIASMCCGIGGFSLGGTAQQLKESGNMTGALGMVILSITSATIAIVFASICFRKKYGLKGFYITGLICGILGVLAGMAGLPKVL
jgi:hypothetical protein